MSNTVRKDTIKSQNEAFDRDLPQDASWRPANSGYLEALFEGMFFDPRKFDFSRVRPPQRRTSWDARKKDWTIPLFSPRDFFDVIDYVLKLKRVSGEIKLPDGDALSSTAMMTSTIWVIVVFVP